MIKECEFEFMKCCTDQKNDVLFVDYMNEYGINYENKLSLYHSKT